MKAFIIGLYIQFRGDMRDKGVLMVYYFVPILFYLVMGSILKLPGLESSANPITSITIFASESYRYNIFKQGSIGVNKEQMQ